MNRNQRLLVMLLLFALAMLGVAYAFVPLYRVFCQAFGIPLPSVAVSAELAAPKAIAGKGRVITVMFSGHNDATMPVTLQPRVTSMKVRLGEPALTAYVARNPGSTAVDGVAVHMLAAMGGPDGLQLAPYVELRQCFCFEEQHYPAGKELTLPVSFTVTPDLPPEIHTILFNYTLFPADKVPEGVQPGVQG